MVKPTGPIGDNRKPFISFINGLNILAGLAIHDDTQEILEEIFTAITKKGAVKRQSLVDDLMDTLKFIRTLNEDVKANSENSAISFNEIDISRKPDEDE